MGPEFLTLGLTAIVSAIGGGSWVANKILERQSEKIKSTAQQLEMQNRRLDHIEDHINRMPIEYVLKVDFLREIQGLHDNFRQIHNKLDTLIEKLLTK
jgi:hypothetical protein